LIKKNLQEKNEISIFFWNLQKKILFSYVFVFVCAYAYLFLLLKINKWTTRDFSRRNIYCSIKVLVSKYFTLSKAISKSRVTTYCFPMLFCFFHWLHMVKKLILEKTFRKFEIHIWMGLFKVTLYGLKNVFNKIFL